MKLDHDPHHSFINHCVLQERQHINIILVLLRSLICASLKKEEDPRMNCICICSARWRTDLLWIIDWTRNKTMNLSREPWKTWGSMIYYACNGGKYSETCSFKHLAHDEKKIIFFIIQFRRCAKNEYHSHVSCKM